MCMRGCAFLCIDEALSLIYYLLGYSKYPRVFAPNPY